MNGTNFSVAGTSEFTDTATFTGNIDANGSIDVDGHAELDNVNIAGVSTFNDDITFNGAQFNATYDRSQNTFNFDPARLLRIVSAPS